MHNEIQLMSQEKERYVEECVALRREKEEVEHASARLNEEKQEVEQVSARLRAEKEQVEQASIRLKTVIIEVMKEVTTQAYPVDEPVEKGLTKVKAIMQELRMRITDLETRVTPSTPLEKMESREELTKDAIINLEAYEAQCMEQYNQYP